MTREQLRSAQTYYLQKKEIKKGIDAFEKYVGRIEWMHPSLKTIEGKKYVVKNQKGEIIFEADSIPPIAKEFCVTESRISMCLSTTSLLNSKYIVERWQNE
jgi:hypothetical protein